MGRIKQIAIDQQEHISELVNDLKLPALSPPPKTAKCTCDILGTTIVSRHDRSTASAWRSANWRECPGCLQRRANRAAKQALCELDHVDALYLSHTSAEEFKKLKERWKKRNQRGSNIRYCGYLQQDGSYAVLHNTDDLEIDYDIANYRNLKLSKLLAKYVNTAAGKRANCSPRWGGNYAGTKGNTKETRERKKTAGNKRHVTYRAKKLALQTVANYFKTSIKAGRVAINKKWDIVYTGITNIAPTADILRCSDGRIALDVLIERFVNLEQVKQDMHAKMSRINDKEKTAVSTIIYSGHSDKVRRKNAIPAPLSSSRFEDHRDRRWSETAVQRELEKLAALPLENINKSGSAFSLGLLRIAAVVKGSGREYLKIDDVRDNIERYVRHYPWIAPREIQRQWRRAYKTAVPRYRDGLTRGAGIAS